ncbi:hypothetical protein UY3_07150 [Chelonia mydas]|uniref:Uncharacterized protein n=1 Tax=Chelonia mydas TaxID=8469 RepID=M7BEQ5_CHEMY|nr:hypothetical protein UY3_07150 [Chelonia mydas]
MLAAFPAAPIGLERGTMASGSRDRPNLRTRQMTNKPFCFDNAGCVTADLKILSPEQSSFHELVNWQKGTELSSHKGGVPQCSAVTALQMIFNSTAQQPGTQETAHPLLKPPKLWNLHFLFDQPGELTSPVDHGDSTPQTLSSLEYTGGCGTYWTVLRGVCAATAPIQPKKRRHLQKDGVGYGGEGLHQGHAQMPHENQRNVGRCNRR